MEKPPGYPLVTGLFPDRELCAMQRLQNHPVKSAAYACGKQGCELPRSQPNTIQVNGKGDISAPHAICLVLRRVLNPPKNINDVKPKR